VWSLAAVVGAELRGSVCGYCGNFSDFWVEPHRQHWSLDGFLQLTTRVIRDSPNFQRSSDSVMMNGRF